MFTIVKFFSFPNSKFKFSTRTLGKIGVPVNIDNMKIGLWIVEIVNEKHKGKPKGVFKLKPIKYLDEVEILYPPFYTKKIINGICFVTPKFKSNYMLPIKIRKMIFKQNPSIYSIITILKK